jgi:hypothetical protein
MSNGVLPQKIQGGSVGISLDVIWFESGTNSNGWYYLLYNVEWNTHFRGATSNRKLLASSKIMSCWWILLLLKLKEAKKVPPQSKGMLW